MTLTDRVALVTGGGVRVGRAISLELATAGARVAVHYHASAARAETVAAEIRQAGGEAALFRLDLAQTAELPALIERVTQTFGRLDVLVNNAGISGGAQPAHELDLETWDRVIAVNLRGPFLCAKHAIPHLIAGGGGSIVNIASTYGLIGAPLASAYCASKGGVVNLTRQLAIDYGRNKIRVNAICPGYVDTDMGGHRASLPPEQAAAANARREASAALQPLGRQAQAEEIARVAVFLASQESSFMTGSIVTVDGGCTATFNHGSR